ncbi:hypothetical protein BH23PLA1_BH23PLA1_35700 [soil metagenome]
MVEKLLRSGRAWYWIGGLGVLAGAWRLAPWEGRSREFGPVVLLLAWGLVGLVAEVVALLRAARSGGDPSPTLPRPTPRDTRPPDGEVEIAPVRGVQAEPNPKAPEFRRFLAIEPLPGESPVRALRFWDRRFPPLLGRVVIVSVFIGRDGKGWSDEEIAGAHRALRRAGIWIEREADRWNAAVNVDLAETYFAALEEESPHEVAIPAPEGSLFDDSPRPDDNAEAVAHFSRAAARLGFVDAVDLTGRIARRIDADHLVWLLHHRRAGQSIAVPSDLSGLPGVTLAVCYAREERLPEPLHRPPFPDPVTFVHELLHLFGALDKYDCSLASFPRGMVSDRDVMCLNTNALSRLRIDPLTADEIGWEGPPRPDLERGKARR